MKSIQNNKEYAEKLTKLMTENPDLKVHAMIDTDRIDDDYSYMVGYLYEPEIVTVAVNYDNAYIEFEGDDYEDCCNYYGCFEADDWSDEELEEKAKQIPWEKIIAIYVSAT